MRFLAGVLAEGCIALTMTSVAIFLLMLRHSLQCIAQSGSPEFHPYLGIRGEETIKRPAFLPGIRE